MSMNPEECEFDPDLLREKYRTERDRRMRPDGENQYAQATAELAHFDMEDPWANAPTPRESYNDEVEAIIVGAGFSGLLAAARFREAGIGVDDLRIIDFASDFGGNWYWNRYPGAQCDIESYCYLPLLEETGYIPKEKYSYQPEIFEHARRIATHYGLYENALFQTAVTSMRWDESLLRWIVRTNRDDVMRARFVVVCPGNLSRPKLPGIPGIEDFGGVSFHTSRWDYEFTGGDHSGNLTKLLDKRVALIGTGASAVQCVPSLGEYAEHLYVFQRTPSSVAERGNKPTDPEWVKTLTPGWQQRRRENFTDAFNGKDSVEDLVNDGWTKIGQKLKVAAFGISEYEDRDADSVELRRLSELADFELMNEVRARVDEVVRDPATAEALKPWYRQLCKRPCFNDSYLPTFNRPNVTLVDVATAHGIERVTPRGIVANGIEYPVECIIYSTGYETGTSWRRHFNYDVIGKNDESLFDHWDKRIRTLHGHSSHGFPNWFFIGQGQNAPDHNYTHSVDVMAKHLAYIVCEVYKRGATVVEASAGGEDAWVAEIDRNSALDLDFWESCTPGFYSREGTIRESKSTFFSELYAPGANAFNALLAKWRDSGDLAGLELR